MATVAARAPKRDLAPDWRDALRDAVRRLCVRTVGLLLIGVSLAGAVALASHSPNDPSLSTAAGGPPANWLGSVGAYASDLLLLLFGLGSVFFLPVIALAGLRMLRLRSRRAGSFVECCSRPSGPCVGVALGLTSGSAVSGLPGGWGGALGLAGAHGVAAALGLIPDPAIAGPCALTCCCFSRWRACAGLFRARPGRRGTSWFAGLLRRQPRERAQTARD